MTSDGLPPDDLPPEIVAFFHKLDPEQFAPPPCGTQVPPEIDELCDIVREPPRPTTWGGRLWHWLTTPFRAVRRWWRTVRWAFTHWGQR